MHGAESHPDTLAPGETGEVRFTIKLDRPLNGQRMIMVHSNDPKTPNVHLTLQIGLHSALRVQSENTYP